MKYGVIVADPPWEFGDSLSMSKIKRGASANYPTLGLNEIVCLRVKDVVADRAVLALWVPASLLYSGLAAVESWGFRHKQVWVWLKRSSSGKLAFGMGRLARNACELCLVGTRGPNLYDDLADKTIRNVFEGTAKGHSAKPESIQDALERMFPTYDKLELFARRDRPGWTCVGAECPSTLGEDVRQSITRLSDLARISPFPATTKERG